MSKIDYDNERDRYSGGFDSGSIVDGTVIFDPEKGEYVVVDDDFKGFSSQDLLKSLDGKKVRMTIVSWETMRNLEEMYMEAQKEDSEVIAPVLIDPGDAN